MAYYQINIDYITNVFCVNKEKVEMACNGKCHLAKQLQATENPSEDGKTTLHILDVVTVVFLQKTQCFTISNPSEFINKNILNSYNKLYTFNFQSFQFKPPRFIA
ncbi:hypothetical protein FUA26_10805 [Seonamhaeicola algicola]|uniref:Uncharacterized protein n=1 Tax=Seonamhaeicola algicola TaxID=1719036 RepID=A0A5C7APR8_9FLAO|nr:hypothetical protein [Seonamhaeicola algicola]TXE09964.1 hypothetical protein FUA26_10805 [Seonamhaeicola algicola]